MKENRISDQNYLIGVGRSGFSSVSVNSNGFFENAMKRLYPIGVKLYSENGYSDFRFTNYTNYAIDEYIEQFVVLNETFKYSQKTAGLQTISNMINHLCKTNTDMPNAIKFVMTSNYRGLLQYDGQAIPINSNLTINSLTGFEYFVDSTITETYLEKIQYLYGPI